MKNSNSNKRRVFPLWGNKREPAISIWRYSHLALAVSSFVFIVLASVTGIVLAFQPIQEQMAPYKTANLDDVSVAETLSAFQEKYPETIDISVDANGFVSALVFMEEGDDLEGYFNPNTAEYLGKKLEPSPFFQWVTNFHRSLFLKSTGRFFVGLCSFLLFLIAVSGSILVIQRQRGLKRFFSRIVNDNFNQYWHVVLGRLSLVPIIIITLTGVYLSLEKFDLLPKHAEEHHIDFENLSESPKLNVSEFPVFQDTKLSEVKQIEFPFSPDVEDYFTLKLKGEELVINQFTGNVLNRLKSPWVDVYSRLSLNLHTGKGSVVWSIILAIATANILFFIYSGFSMTFKRRTSKLKNKFKPNEAETVVLVGSENGSTVRFANAFYKGLIAEGEKAFIAQMNDYERYKNIKNMVVFTATYGQGDAPTNANKFLQLLKKVEQERPFAFLVVGFGSYAYPDFCQFAKEVDTALEKTKNTTRFTHWVAINDKSVEVFQQFVSLWNDKTGVQVSILQRAFETKPKHLKTFSVVSKTEVQNQLDNTFLITLKRTNSYLPLWGRAGDGVSGDLLSIYPEDNHRERLYSIGKTGRNIQLSVKWFENGLGSNFLNSFNKNDTLKAKLIRNQGFHFPKKAKRVVFIANGTGIAPFLGMLNDNKSVETHLYFGLRTQRSLDLYKAQIDGFLESKKLSKLQLVLSQEGQKQYVQDLVKQDANFIAETLKNQGVLMLCGSLKMEEGVFEVLKTICQEHCGKPLSFYLKNKQVKTDCY